MPAASAVRRVEVERCCIWKTAWFGGAGHVRAAASRAYDVRVRSLCRVAIARATVEQVAHPREQGGGVGARGRRERAVDGAGDEPLGARGSHCAVEERALAG